MTDTDLWDKEWFMYLSPKLKCLVKFVRDKCDIAGVWQSNWVLASTYIGEKVTEEELLNIDNGLQFEKVNDNKIYCKGFVFFQYGELKDKSPIHIKVKSLLQKHGILDRVLIGYSKGINTLKEKEEEKEEYKEEEQINYNKEFEKFWKIYDKDIQRVQCEYVWANLLPSDIEDIMKTIEAYVKVNNTKQYRKNPLNYLNGRCWDDELPEPPKKQMVW